ncbi:MAG: hypothetical protein AAFV33_22405 [Chloroflexota bacterium]
MILLAIMAPVVVIAVVWQQTGTAPSLFGSLPPQIPPPDAQEGVVVAPGAAVTTANPYSGPLTLVVEGSLTPDEATLIDAFYRHTDSIGLPLDTPVPIASPLQVNGAPMDDPRPDYDPFHVYMLPYNAGDTPQPLELAIIGDAQGGQLRVFIIENTP